MNIGEKNYRDQKRKKNDTGGFGKNISCNKANSFKLGA